MIAHFPEAMLPALRSYYRDPSEDSRRLIEQLPIYPLKGGLNNSLFLLDDDGTRQCIKLYRVDDRRRAEREWQSLSLLHQSNIRIAPQPFWSDVLSDVPAVGMEYIDGVPLSQQAVGHYEMLCLAKTLQQLYAITPERCDYPYVAIGRACERLEKLSLWSQQLDTFKLHPLGSTIRDLLHQWPLDKDATILCLPAPPVFSSGDPNLANCLWDGSSIQCVDFEYAGWSDLAFELADLLEGLFARQISDTCWELFLEQFDLAAPDIQARFSSARRLCAMYWIFLLWNRLMKGHDVTDALCTYIQRMRCMLSVAHEESSLL